MEEVLRWKTPFDGRRLLVERFRDSALPYTAVAVIFFRCIRKPENVLGFRINDIVLSVPIVPNAVQDNSVVLVSDVTCMALAAVCGLPSIHTQGT